MIRHCVGHYVTIKRRPVGLGQLFRCTLLISIKTVCFDEQVTRNGYESSRQQAAALQHCDSISFSWNVTNTFV